MSSISPQDSGKIVMSNHDRIIDRAVEKYLLAHPEESAAYPGRGFVGYVWRLGEEWACEVWQYGAPLKVVYAESLQEIMDKVSAQFGDE